MTKPVKDVNLIQIDFTQMYNKKVLLPYKAAAQLMELLGSAEIFVDNSYGDKSAIIPQLDKNDVQFTPMDMTQYAQLNICAVLGITHNEYLLQLEKEKEQDATK